MLSVCGRQQTVMMTRAPEGREDGTRGKTSAAHSL